MYWGNGFQKMIKNRFFKIFCNRIVLNITFIIFNLNITTLVVYNGVGIPMNVEFSHRLAH